MKIFRRSITVVGTGSYGTALAIAIARNGHYVFLWGRNLKKQKKLQINRCNSSFLPGMMFPKTLIISKKISDAIQSSSDVLIVVPSHTFADLLHQIQPFLKKNSRIVWATKGLEHNTGRLLQEVAREILGNDIPLAVIAGPSFAKELAAGLPTAITLSATDITFARDLQKLFYYDKNLRVYNNTDFVGVQIGGAVKNVIAIGAGISDGIGFGANARTALITRGLTEMTRLGIALGANITTFMGMAGLGDLMLSCTDNQSRNRRFGILLGKGIKVEKAQDSIGQIVEGYHNTKEVKTLANKYNVEMPITEQIYQVLYCNKDAYEAALTLLSRSKKNENCTTY